MPKTLFKKQTFLRAFIFPLKSRRCKSMVWGFTLVELVVIVCIVIILVLAFLSILNPESSSIAKNRDVKRISEINTLRASLQMYYMDKGQYPSSTENEEWCSLEASSEDPNYCPDLSTKLRPYLQLMPGDPLYGKGKEPSSDILYSYQYVSTSSGQGYKIHADLETKEPYEIGSLIGNKIVYWPPGSSLPSNDCGNGIIEPPEDCDGTNLGGQTCVSLGFTGGTLACATDCTFDTSGCTGTPSPPSLATDVNVIANSTAGTPITAQFSTANTNELLIAFVSSNVDDAGAISTVGGAGLTWTRVVQYRASSYGLVSIWKAYSAALLTNVTVNATATETSGDYRGTLLYVVSFRNASSSVGAVATSSQPAGQQPSISITTTKDNSWVWAVGEDWTTRNTHVATTGQTITAQWLNATDDSTHWTQKMNATTSASSTLVKIQDSAPTTDKTLFSAVEIIPL